MNRSQKIWLWAGNILVGLSGIILAVVKTFYQAPPPVDEFDLGGLAHPWQSMTQHLHLWLAPILVIGIGMTWHAHAWTYFRNGVREGVKSGLGLLAVAAPMVVSGYAISTSVSDTARSVWIWIHLVSSTIWLLTFLLHVWRRRRSNQRNCPTGRRLAKGAPRTA